MQLTLTRDAELRGDQIRLGMWIFLGTVAMLFAAFASAYIVRRSGSDWRPLPLPRVLWVNTFVLLVASAALEAGARLDVVRRWRQAMWLFVSSFALGTAFVAGQYIAWRELVRAGIYLPTNPSSSFFFMLTGAHLLHIVAALGVIAWAGSATWDAGRRDPVRWRVTADVARVFTHFLCGVWLFLLALVSLY
jgi:cytochrome c oxidase subunit 3